MAGFSEAWLRDYNARRAAVAPVPTGNVVRFTLCRPTPLLNQLIRMHWRARMMLARSISAEVARLVPAAPARQPLEHACVTIVRYSVGIPDHDGLVGGCKLLIDTLLVLSKRHPNGLGFIVDDDPAHMTLVVRAERCANHKDQRTEVTIESPG